ncbi:UNVERIFIED_CONTAM: hypothetical protein K2H54_068475 [Gekko kuhli]
MQLPTRHWAVLQLVEMPIPHQASSIANSCGDPCASIFLLCCEVVSRILVPASSSSTASCYCLSLQFSKGQGSCRNKRVGGPVDLPCLQNSVPDPEK